MTKPFQAQDKYFHKAKDQGKRARSYFKLQAIQEKFRLLRPGMHVLDLGAAPGSFCECVIETVGRSGFVLGVDLKPITPLGPDTYVRTLVGDIYEDATKEEIARLHPGKFDGIVSDLAPATTGMKDVDQYESAELSFEVLRHTNLFVKKGGFCVVKIFQGEEFQGFLRFAKKRYQKVSVFKPDASRDRSKECYVICQGLISTVTKAPRTGEV